MSEQTLLMGTDIGTQGTKTLIVDTKGRILSSSFMEYDIIQPRPTWAEQWPDVWYQAACQTIKGSIEKANINPEQIGGIAISGLYGGSGVPVNESMKPIRPCIIWMDRRATEQVKWIKKNMDLDELFNITGNYVDTYYGYTKMLWIKDNEPNNWNKISKFIPPNNYVIYKLTGELASDYSSAGNIGGIFDLRKRKWSSTLLKELGISPDSLPERLVKSSEVVGTITKEGSKLTGLLEGTPVIAGGIDAAVATLSAGAFEEGDHVAMVGTSMCWGTVHDGENLSKKLVSMPYVAYPEEKIYTWGGAATAGALPRWFRDEFSQLEKEVGKKIDVNSYKLLDLKAEKVPPGSEGLLILPYFMGERSPIWNPDARGTIIGLTLYHTKAHIFRALLEGVAYSLRHNMEVGKDMGMELRRNCLLVGGASKSQLWKEIFADVTGYPMQTLVGEIEAPLGDALLAGLGVGIVENYTEIRNWLEFDETLMPDKKTKKVYDSLFEQYLEIYKNLKDNMQFLSSV